MTLRIEAGRASSAGLATGCASRRRSPVADNSRRCAAESSRPLVKLLERTLAASSAAAMMGSSIFTVQISGYLCSPSNRLASLLALGLKGGDFDSFQDLIAFMDKYDLPNASPTSCAAFQSSARSRNMPKARALSSSADTHVLCTASLEERLPQWLKGQGRGWVTAEYAMLPRSTTSAPGAR